MRIAVLLLAVVAAVSALPRDRPASQRIVGGTLTTIERYPFFASLLESDNMVAYFHVCGGTILNARAILTAAHCYVYFIGAEHFRVRVGSSYANSGGVVHEVALNILHPSFGVEPTFDHDIAICKLKSTIVFNDQTRPASIAGENYLPRDNEEVWACGHGATWYGGHGSEQLRHVQIWIVNQSTCRQRYATVDNTVSNNMICSGWLDVGGRDQCYGDSGGPLVHNNVVVGVCSWGYECARAYFPGINVRVSRYASWIARTA